MCGTPLEASSPKKKVDAGNDFYKEKDYLSAQEKYREALEKESESDIINFNLGAALYKNKKYEEAINYFQKVFLSEDEELKEKAYYNSGNGFYQKGIELENSGDLDSAVSSLENSLGQYKKALAIDKEDGDTKHNYSFINQELQRLIEKKKQQQQQKQQQGDEKDSKSSEEQNQQGQNQGEEGQENQQSQSEQEEEEQEDPQQKEQKNQEQNGGKDQDQQDEQKDGGNSQESNDQQRAEDGQTSDASELTRREAQMLLESYQQTEEPQEQFNMRLKASDDSPVLKDW